MTSTLGIRASMPSISNSDSDAEMAARYSSIGSSYEAAFGHDKGLLQFLQRTLPHLPNGASVLDVGCGTGNPVAASLTAAGHCVTGIDFSEEMVRLCRQTVPDATFEVADMRTWKPPPSALRGTKTAYDAILVILSLFTFSREEIEELVKKWGEWLEPGRLLCIASIAAEDSKPEKYDKDGHCARDIGVRFMGQNVFITLFTKEGWKHLLGKNNFEILDTLTDLHVPPPKADSDAEMHYFLVARKTG